MMLPVISSHSNNSGMAVISLDFSVTLVCPNTRWFSQAQALTIWIAALFELRSLLRRTRLPSIAITFPFVKEDKSLTQLAKHWPNCLLSMAAKTFPRVSWEGIPCFSPNNFVNQSSFALPNSSIATQLSAPHITAQMVIKNMSSSLCSFWRFIRDLLYLKSALILML